MMKIYHEVYKVNFTPHGILYEPYGFPASVTVNLGFHIWKVVVQPCHRGGHLRASQNLLVVTKEVALGADRANYPGAGDGLVPRVASSSQVFTQK